MKRKGQSARGSIGKGKFYTHVQRIEYTEFDSGLGIRVNRVKQIMHINPRNYA